MEKPHVLVIFPTPRDRRYLSSPRISNRCHIRFFGDYLENPLNIQMGRLLKSAFEEAKSVPRLQGVIATDDYPAAFVASLLAVDRGLPGPAPESVLLCQHKYYSRIAQRRSIAEVVPPFSLIPLNGSNGFKTPPLPFPFFVKPVKGVLSILSEPVSSRKELQIFLRKARRRLPSFARPFDRLMREAGLNESYPIGGQNLIAEGILQGLQVTLEGYVFQGKVFLIDFVDSIFYPGTHSFQRFERPTKLPSLIQKRMFRWAERFLQSIGFDNSLFNFEFLYDPRKKTVRLLEVNSRMAHQFAGMMEAVHGTNPYEILVDLALGRRPRFRRMKGKEHAAASFVLRKFEDREVKSVPTVADLLEVQRLFPGVEVEILVKPQHRLSDFFRQDEISYRYAIINLSAPNKKELFRRFKECEKRLPFAFSQIRK
jgi:hypothetical protein